MIPEPTLHDAVKYRMFQWQCANGELMWDWGDGQFGYGDGGGSGYGEEYD